MKKTRRIGLISIITLILMFVVSMSVFAAKTVTILDGKITITDSTGNGSGNATKYTAQAKGSLISKKSNTIEIANASGKDGVLSFNYTAASANSFTVAGSSASATGSYSNSISAGGKVTIVIQSKSGLSGTTATLTLENITFEEVKDSSSIVYNFDSSLGTVTAGGTAISSGTTLSVDAVGTQMVATAKSGVTFLGWIDNADGSIISQAATYTQQATGDMTVTAIFSNGTTPYFLVDKKYIISDLNTAVGKGSEIVLICNGTLPAGNYTIPSGKILSIPMDSSNTIYRNKPAHDRSSTEDNTYYAGTLYRKFTLASGVNITVNGELSVAGKLSTSQGSHGSLIGTYAQMVMNSGSTITVNNGAKLYSWGFITGSGSITAKSGSTVYEPFQVRDWRGGDATTNMMDNTQRVFPFSQYYVQNIEVPLTIEAGAIENGFMAIYVTLAGNQASEVPFIGPNGMFNITSGYAIKDYDENTDRLKLEIKGTLEMDSLELSMRLSLLGSATIKSENYSLPINGNITLDIKEGSNINISQDMALLPGGEIYVRKGAKCIFESGAKAFIYDSSEWGGYCSQHSLKFMAANLAPGRKYTRKESDLKDAIIYIEGEVDATDAEVYTTKSGASVQGAEGGLVKLKPGAQTVTYQVTQSSSNITGYPEIPVTTAYLKNGDGKYVDPEVLGNCCTSYIYTNGVWTPNTIAHTNEETVAGTPATCTASGLTDGKTCTACGTVIQTQTTIPATGHTYGAWVADGDNHKKTCTCGDAVTEAHKWNSGTITTPATHASAGVKTYTCTECSATRTETIEKVPHSYGAWEKDDANNHKKVCSCGDVITEAHTWNGGVETTPATCTKDGVKTYTCTVCSETYTEAILSTGHSYGDWEKDDANNHKKVCACGDVITETHAWNEGVETQAPTHTVDGVKTYTCTVCNETREEAISATGHSHGNWEKADDDNHKKTCSCGNVITEPHAWNEGVVTTPATHFASGEMTYTCSECNGTKTEVIEKIPHSHGDWEVDGDNHKKTCSCGDVITEAHAWDTGVVTLQPTHKEDGERTYTCLVCNHKKTEVIEKIPHSYGEWIPNGDENHKKVCLCGDFVTDVHKWDEGVVTTPATHFASGIMTYTCSDCNHTRTEVIEIIPHAHGEWEKNDGDTHKKVCECGDVITEAHAWDGGVITIPATHTVDGVKTYTCTVCGETYTEVIKAEGHSTTYVPEVLATCTQDGTKAHYICSGCDVKFANAEATEVITDLVIPSVGHAHGEWEKNDADTHKKVCFCGDIVTESHAWDGGVETLAPTHTTEGVKTYTCTVCGEQRTEAIDKTPDHEWDNGVITTPATHFATGVKTYTCTCGETYTEVVEIIPHAHGEWEKNDADTHKKVCECGDVITELHAWDGGVETLAPTHTAEGVMTYTCTVCGEQREEAIDKTPDHEWDGGVITTPATHFATGVKTYTCTCGDTYTEVVEIIPHAHGEWEKNDADTHKKVCECGDVITEAHAWDGGVITEPATHFAEGVKTYTCTVCGEQKTEVIEIIPHAHGGWEKNDADTHKKACECGDEILDAHKWNNGVVTVHESHYSDGEKLYTCTVCGEQRTEVIPMVPHEYGEWTSDKNNHSKICSCGDVIREPHEWNEGVITTPATHTSTGVKTYTCTVCERTRTETIEKIPHAYGEWEKNDADTHKKVCECGDVILDAHAWDGGVITEPATHIAEGVKTYTCTVCNETKTESIAKTPDHEWDNGVVTTPATHTADGEKTYTCICNETYTEVIPKIAHTHGEWEKNDEYSHKKVCECGDVILDAHDWDEGVVTQAPTSTEDGVKTYTCSVCGEAYTETIPATGTGGSTTGGSTTGGSSSDDGEIGDSCETGHSWDEIVIEATHNKAGAKTYTCSVCGETYTEVIPKIPHEYGEWTIDKYNHNSTCECGYVLMKAHVWDDGVETYPAECDQPGVKTYTCTVCNYEKTEKIPALGHTYGEWMQNEKNHSKECSCGYILKENHEWDITEDATCSEDGTRTYRCTVCEYEKAEAIPAIGHAFGAWEFDGESHKRECACGETEIVTHIGDDYDCALCNDEEVVTETSYIIEDGQIKLNTELALDVPAGTQIIVALYNADGKMLYASVAEASVIDEMAFDSSEVAKIRIFTWSGFNSMSPITTPEEIIITSAL